MLYLAINDNAHFSQRGTHFRTICESCNSRLLGTEYDPHLIGLFNEVSSRLKACHEHGMTIPSVSHHFVKTHRVARAVVGHLLAANSVSQVREGRMPSPFYDALSEYFLDKTMDMPEGLNIYYWIYPYRHQIIARSVGKISLEWAGFLVGDVIKFPPFGFWLIWEKPHHLQINLPLLVKNKVGGIDATEQVSMYYKNIPKPDFPETPSAHEAVMIVEEMSSVAIDA